MRGNKTAQQALHCDAKMRYCGQSMLSIGDDRQLFDVNRHSTIEFRPQRWWIDISSYYNCSQLVVVCFHELYTAFPTLRRSRVKQANNNNDNMKGYWYVHKFIRSAVHREYITSVLYQQDTELYTYYCTSN